MRIRLATGSLAIMLVIVAMSPRDAGAQCQECSSVHINFHTWCHSHGGPIGSGEKLTYQGDFEIDDCGGGLLSGSCDIHSDCFPFATKTLAAMAKRGDANALALVFEKAPQNVNLDAKRDVLRVRNCAREVFMEIPLNKALATKLRVAA